MRDSLVSRGIFVLLLSVWPLILHAQNETDERFSFDFRGVELSEALDEIAKETGIDLVYDPEIIRDIYVYERIQRETISDLLKNLLEETRVDYITLSSGTFVIVEAVLERPSHGTYYGRVTDSETGEPLPGAAVMLADASGGTRTGQAGRFSLNRLVSGTYRIVFSYMGYEPVYKTVEIGPDENVREEVTLEPEPIDFAPIVVTGHLPQMPNGSHQDQFADPESEWETNGGSMRDAIRSLSLFSGVQYGLPMTDLHLQGGQKGEHRIMLDGVPVYNPHSFGQMFSAFSPYAISRAELHKAGYEVNEGSQIAGIVDMKHEMKNKSGALIQGDPLSLNLRSDLYLPGDEESGLKIMGAARTNYWDLYREPTLNRTLQEWDDLDPLIADFLLDDNSEASLYEPKEHQADVRFHDIHFASEYEIDRYNTLSGSLYLGENFVNTDMLRQNGSPGDRPEYLYASDEYMWKNFMGQLSYDREFSPRLDINSRLSISSNRFRQRYLIGTNTDPEIPAMGVNTASAYDAFQLASKKNRVPAQRNSNSIKHFIFRSDATYSFSPLFRFETGVQMDYAESSINLSDLFYLPTLSDQTSTFFSTYLNGRWSAGDYWSIAAGSRLTYHTDTGKFYPEPRANIQYDRPDSDIGYWSARISGGVYRQFVNQYEITNPGPTSLVPSFPVWSHAGTSEMPKAWHLSGSFILEPAEQTMVKLEAYHKWQPTSYMASYSNLIEGVMLNRSTFEAFAETTRMKSYGAGIRLNQAVADARLKLMAGYDYNLVRVDMNTQFGRTLQAPWNEPHRFQFRALWQLYSNVTTVAKWQSTMGRAWGFRQAYYDFLFPNTGGGGAFSFANPEDDRLSPFHQLDLSLIYKPSLTFMDAEIRLDLINLLNRRNTIDWSLRPVNPGEEPEEYEKRERTMPGFTPSLSIQLQF